MKVLACWTMRTPGQEHLPWLSFFFLLLPLFTLSTLSFLPTSLTILLLFFSPLGVCSTGDHQNALRSNVPIRAGLLSTIIGTGIYRKRKRGENRMEEKPFHPLWSHSQQGLDLRLVYPLTTDEVKGYRQIFAHKKTGKKKSEKNNNNNEKNEPIAS